MEELLEIEIKGIKVKYLTKPGIFSKHGLDDGTKLLLENVEVADNTLVADLCGGAGIISLVIAKLNKHGHVHLLDEHLRPIELAKKNVELNSLSNVEVFLSDLFSTVENRTYQQILSNPPQHLGNEFLLELVEEVRRHLKPKGEFWVVIKNNLKPVMEKFLNQVFGNYILIKTGQKHSVLKAVNNG